MIFRKTNPFAGSPLLAQASSAQAEALAHCGECHMPRNLLFATKSGMKYAGAIVRRFCRDIIAALPLRTRERPLTWLSHARVHHGANQHLAWE
jgi:hypothetical protein